MMTIYIGYVDDEDDKSGLTKWDGGLWCNGRPLKSKKKRLMYNQPFRCTIRGEKQIYAKNLSMVVVGILDGR